ncbi:MAG: hypothetical protein LBB36_02655 [Fibromonadaceae bacterium]|jgi:hypothetical protein|nr:hypothetical protein [Fibromonadaceae bacterium]
MKNILKINLLKKPCFSQHNYSQFSILNSQLSIYLSISFLILIQTISAQTVISVDENLFRNKDKSLALTIAASAVLPGTGHYYLGKNSRGAAFIWVDAALWVAAGTTYFYGDNQLENARGYAVRHAGAEGAPKNLKFLSLMGDYRSRGGSLYQNSNPDNNEDYNQAMIRAGLDIEAEYPNAYGYIWDWGSSDNPETTARMKENNEMLKRHRIAKIAFQVSLGAMALNRVWAILDALRLYRQTSANFSHLQITPLATPKQSGIFVNYEF